jgi:hypothetical protein
MTDINKVRTENYTSPTLPFKFPNANGTAGVITVSGGVVTIADALMVAGSTVVGASLRVSGASHAANNGTFVITAFVAGTITIANPNAVTGDTGVSWFCDLTVQQLACVRTNGKRFGTPASPVYDEFECKTHATEDICPIDLSGASPTQIAFTRSIYSAGGGAIRVDTASEPDTSATGIPYTLTGRATYPSAVSKFYAVAGGANDVEVNI